MNTPEFIVIFLTPNSIRRNNETIFVLSPSDWQNIQNLILSHRVWSGYSARRINNLPCFLEQYKTHLKSTNIFIEKGVYQKSQSLIPHLHKSVSISLIDSTLINQISTLQFNPSNNHIHQPPGSTLIRFADAFFSKKARREVFEPLVGDWREEYFEALQQKREWKARWISVRYSYAFLAAIWQRSPLGDLIEFIGKFAK